jgi:hypothetical protein
VNNFLISKSEGGGNFFDGKNFFSERWVNWWKGVFENASHFREGPSYCLD